MLKNQVSNLKPGTLIVGKWHQNSYRIIRCLGAGATGVVYLAEEKGRLVALKISFNHMSVTSEVNVLKHFSKVHGKVLGPSLLDVDDWQNNLGRNTISFYAMEYLKGKPFQEFIKAKGFEWAVVLLLQLLSDLHELHKAGWTFGDLKPENLVVTENPIRIRWLDVGGTTLHGRSIKEFTDFYDRGYWGLGTRKAEPSYDLFALAMILINTVYPKRFTKKENSLLQLQQIIEQEDQLKPYKNLLMKALRGRYEQALQMRDDILNVVNNQKEKKPNYKKTRTVNLKKASGRTSLKKRKRYYLVETAVLFFSLMLVYVFYILSQTL